MKRILMLAMIVAFIMIPLMSFAKTAISDSDLGAVTAQTGVSILFNQFTISSLSLSKISWGDNDGVPNQGVSDTGYTIAGYLGANGVTMTGNIIEFNSTNPGTMNIDVGTSGATTAMKIDLGSITLGGAAGMNIIGTMKLGDIKTLDNGNSGNLMIVDIERVRVFLSGTVTVFAH